ncbi:MAG TPA: hypothetical protein VIU40_04405, partial [Geobacteraceae bacterium]
PTFTGSLPSPTAITLRWSNPPGTMFFNLYRSESKGGQYSLLGSVQQDSYTDRTAKAGKSYYYAVTAVDRNNTESDKSAPLEARLTEAEKIIEEKVVVKAPIPRGTFNGEELYEIDQPYDIGFTGPGELYVMDRVGLQFFDKDGKYQRRINFEKNWTAPAACTTEARDGALLVAFNRDKMIRKIDASNGKLIWEKGYPPPKERPEIRNNPTALAVDKEGNIWVCDSGRFQLIKMDPAFDKVLGVVGRVSGTYTADQIKDDDLPGITRVAFNPNDGKIYVLMSLAGQVKVIDPVSLKVEKTFGGVGLRTGQFQALAGISFRKNGNILILDQMMQVVKEFSKDHQYVATYANVSEKGSNKLSSTFGTGLAYREEFGRFYVSANMANVVYVFDMPK